MGGLAQKKGFFQGLKMRKLMAGSEFLKNGEKGFSKPSEI